MTTTAVERPSADASAQRTNDLPLVVDLDGTLVRTDTLHEGMLTLLRQRPRQVFLLPLWLAQGRAGFKHAVADRVRLDAAHLPYNDALLARLREEQGRRELVLCSAADERFVKAIAAHLGLFDDALGSREGSNLKGPTKAATLRDRYGTGGFDYVGNDTADLPVFAVARSAWAVAPTRGLRRRLGEIGNLAVTMSTATHGAPTRWARALRLHQWVKNILVFVPLVATWNFDTWESVAQSLLAFFAFSLVASGVYIVNDLLDLRADRRHPRKRFRPFACGDIPLAQGLAVVPLLLLLGFAVALTLPPWFAPLLAIYYLSTSLYTFWLKRVPLLDTIVLAGLYTLRILGGAAAIEVAPSFWLLAFSMFFFLSLAMAKRHSELVELDDVHSEEAIPGREYRPEDLSTLISQGSASGYAAVLVLALYIDSPGVREQYSHAEIIWLICPLLLYWINKLWLNSQRREITDDPIVWAVTNRVSRAVAVIAVVLLLLARLMP